MIRDNIPIIFLYGSTITVLHGQYFADSWEPVIVRETLIVFPETVRLACFPPDPDLSVAIALVVYVQSRNVFILQRSDGTITIRLRVIGSAEFRIVWTVRLLDAFVYCSRKYPRYVNVSSTERYILYVPQRRPPSTARVSFGH